jgi:hypothetical protein
MNDLENGQWRALTAEELEGDEVWTGRFYRDLTCQELREGRTAEPTMPDPEPGDQVP